VLGPGPRTGGFATCFGEVSGLSTMNAPDFTASVGASYTVPVHETGSVRLSVLYNYNSGYVFDADNKTSQPEYDLFNASLEYRPTENFGIELWGRNLFDEQYAVQKIASSGISVNTSLGAPRTYGVNFKVRY
jgi:iron complex outermembrane recepter protein